MCEANADALIFAIKEDFKKDFGIDLTEDDFTENEDGFEIDYRDYDLDKMAKYNHSPLVEISRYENDGRSEYIRVYSYLTFEDYFDVENIDK